MFQHLFPLTLRPTVEGGGDGGGGGEGGGGGGGAGGEGGGGSGGDPTPTPPTPPKDTGAEARIKALNDAKKAAEDRAKEAERKLKEREDADLTDKERAEKAATEAEERATAAEAKVTLLERSGWARQYAMEANFVDPGDAIALLDLADLDSETKVKNAVAKLAEDKKHLVATGPRTGFGAVGGSPPPSGGEIPLDEEGKPDSELGLGQDMLSTLFGGRRG